MSSMMLATVALSLSGAIDVESALSIQDCVDAAAVIVAVDGIGGIDPAERVHVAVSDAPPEAGSDPYVVDVDIELLYAPPLHRVVPIRAIECKDVPDLVAVLVANHRRAHPKPDTAPVVGTKEKRARERSRERSRELPPPDVQLNSFELKLPEFNGWQPCDGPPSSCGGVPLNVTLGAGATLPLAGRAQVDAALALGKSFQMLLALDGIANKSAGAYGGVGYRVLHNGAVELSIRGLVGGGGGRASRPLTLIDQECVPAEELAAKPPNNVVEINGFKTQLYFAPVVAARMRLGWVFVEAGGMWHLGLDDAPNIFLTFGTALIGG